MSDLAWSRLRKADKTGILQGLRGSVLQGGPFHVELQPTDRCNVECRFCSTRWLRAGHELPPDRVRSLVEEMRALGTNAVTLCGGGEPLFYSHLSRLLDLLIARGPTLTHVTTNGTRLTPALADALCAAGCEEIVVSLNAPDPEGYAELMGTPPAVFHRVVDNLRFLIARPRSRRPRVVVQFLLDGRSYRKIPRMYEFGCELGADKLLFNELAYLPPELKPTSEDTVDMIRLFEEVLNHDEYRRIGAINGFDRDLYPLLATVNARVGRLRSERGWWGRLKDLVERSDQTWGEKVRHHFEMRRKRRALDLLGAHDGCCLVPWYSLTVRASGDVPMCAVIQGSRLGSIHEQTLEELWYGPAFGRVRSQHRRLVTEGAAWRADPERDRDIVSMCSWFSPAGQDCNFRSFYYCLDQPFLRRLHRTIDAMRAEPESASG